MMIRSYIAGIGHYVPEWLVTNDDLSKIMDTYDEWIQERTGIKERRYGKRHKETTTTMGARAAEIALQRAGTTKEEIDKFINALLDVSKQFVIENDNVEHR